MIKEIKKLLESLFDDDDDELFNDDNIGITNDLLEDDARKIREQLLKGIVVSDNDLELVCGLSVAFCGTLCTRSLQSNTLIVGIPALSVDLM